MQSSPEASTGDVVTERGRRRRNKSRQLLLVDKTLATKRNDVECGKVLWGRIRWCAAPFLGSRWWSAGEVDINSMVLELKQGKGSRGSLDSVGEMKATGQCFGSLAPWCAEEWTAARVEAVAGSAALQANGRWEVSGVGPELGCWAGWPGDLGQEEWARIKGEQTWEKMVFGFNKSFWVPKLKIQILSN
jgi:hypothetical protein